jgi:hypothetical protein
LNRFLKRVEKQTGKQIKQVRTDGGVEYMKEFLAHIQAEGLMKEKGIPYPKHHPPKAERVHQTILRGGRTNLKQSKLPKQMYNESQRYTAYIYNRTVHGSDCRCMQCIVAIHCTSVLGVWIVLGWYGRPLGWFDEHVLLLADDALCMELEVSSRSLDFKPALMR